MKYVLMDLDGTITNPKLGITKSLQYALKKMDITEDDLDSLTIHIGPPILYTFRDYYGFDKHKADEAVVNYREYFQQKGLYENEVYEGMKELLIKLKQAGKKLIVATSKPEIFAQRILEHFDLAEYFDDVCGATLDYSRSKKEEIIRYALERNQITEYGEVVMVGDRKYDVEGAKAFGVPTIGVLYGFGSREELEEAGAYRICEDVSEVYDVIMKL
jgi:phosphoglycolate phosphatase